jgi:hypothetical protein
MTVEHVHAHAVRASDDVEPAAGDSILSRPDNSRWGDPLWSRAVVSAQHAAEDIAPAYRHPDAGTNHLQAGLLREASSELTSLAAHCAASTSPRLTHDLTAIEPAWRT